jgi:hypothetical protein
MIRDTYLESYADGTMAIRRPQFAGVKTVFEERVGATYGVLSAPCGYRHSTRINLDSQGRRVAASCDGVTILCAEHAGVEEEFDCEEE